MSRSKKKICIIATVPAAINAFMGIHIERLAKSYSILLLTNGELRDINAYIHRSVDFHHIAIHRDISVMADVKLFFELRKFLAAQAVEAVISLMPKSGLLAMLTAASLKIPVRVHLFTGQVWLTKKGITKQLLRNCDRIVGLCATSALADSHSQREFLISERIISHKRLSVLGNGSICGVDTQRFRPDSNLRNGMREQLGINSTDCVFLYIGRVNEDKGIADLITAHNKIRKSYPCARLIIVGPDDASESFLNNFIRSAVGPGVIRFGYTDNPEKFMACADVFCMPSYREGFGLAVIEAASSGIPAIASRIYGLTDAVEEGATGLMYPAGSIPALYECMAYFLREPMARAVMGIKARQRAIELFSQNTVVDKFYRYIGSMLDFH